MVSLLCDSMPLLDTLRDALLLTLILMLVFVLYKRLIRFLNKKETDAEYAHFTAESGKRDGEHIILKIHFPETVKARVEVRDASNEVISVLFDDVPADSEVEVKVPLSGLGDQRYSYHLITNNQHLSRHFRR